MADLEKNILVVIPVNEDHKKFLEEKAASGDKNCCIRYVNGEEVTKEDVEQANVIVGNVDPSLISGAKNLELLQLNSAGADLYIKAGVMPEGAVLANATGAYGLAVSEHMLGLTFDLIRRLNQYHANQAEHVWKAMGNIISVEGSTILVLGLGDIGPEAGLPVMEGKCVLFKAFGGVDAFPLCVKTKDVDEFVQTVYNISGSFGGINLEDIAAPRCFEIERKLKERCDIPIFHDDQHGTAVITLAGLTNALKVVGKRLEDVRIVINGAGAAAISITKLLLSAGFQHITMCDRKGAIYAGREGLNWIKEEMAQVTNPEKRTGSLADVLAGADVFIGVSAPGVVTKEMVQTMNAGAVIFACANPTPEIFPDDARAGGAAVVATGRSDYPNQINNVLAFPGIFRGALDARASDINDAMKIAAAHALAELVGDDLSADYIIPAAFDPRVRDAVASAVEQAARASGVARV